MPPPNDNFGTAVDMATGADYSFAFVIVGTTVGATLEAGEPAPSGGTTVWYKWSSPSSEEYYASANLGAALRAAKVPLNGNSATMLAALKASSSYWHQFSSLPVTQHPVDIRVYTQASGGTTPATLSEVGYVQGPAQGLKTPFDAVSFLAVKNTTYYIRVDGVVGQDAGTFLLSVFPCHYRPCNSALALSAAVVTDVFEPSYTSFGSVPPGNYTVIYCAGAFCYSVVSGNWVSNKWFCWGTAWNSGGQQTTALFPSSPTVAELGPYASDAEAEAAGLHSNTSMTISQMNQVNFGYGPPVPIIPPAGVYANGNWYLDLAGLEQHVFNGTTWIPTAAITVGGGPPSGSGTEGAIYADAFLNENGNNEYWQYTSGSWIRGTLNDVYITFCDLLYSDNGLGSTAPTFGIFRTQDLCVCEATGSCVGLSVGAPVISCIGSTPALQVAVTNSRAVYFHAVVSLAGAVGFTPITSEIIARIPPNSTALLLFYIAIPGTSVSGTVNVSLADGTAWSSTLFSSPVNTSFSPNGLWSFNRNGDVCTVDFKIKLNSARCSFVGCSVTLHPGAGMSGIGGPLLMDFSPGDNHVPFSFTSTPSGTTNLGTATLVIKDPAGNQFASLLYGLNPLITVNEVILNRRPFFGHLEFRNAGLSPTINCIATRVSGGAPSPVTLGALFYGINAANVSITSSVLGSVYSFSDGINTYPNATVS